MHFFRGGDPVEHLFGGDFLHRSHPLLLGHAGQFGAGRSLQNRMPDLFINGKQLVNAGPAAVPGMEALVAAFSPTQFDRFPV